MVRGIIHYTFYIQILFTDSGINLRVCNLPMNNALSLFTIATHVKNIRSPMHMCVDALSCVVVYVTPFQQVCGQLHGDSITLDDECAVH